ncbi:arsenate reductase family protein [Pararhodobacter aggregans]|uniref:arsenate reductase family protein n=1 Tax=Pararhodobacter aggregans TaxID=404875 RepID=UPI003A94A7B0
MQLWGLKACDTCRKALKALPTAEFRDIRATPLTDAEIAVLLNEFEEALVNRASTTWRGLSEEERGHPSAQLLAQHPALMKRPVIRAGGIWYLGWTPAVRAALGVA